MRLSSLKTKIITSKFAETRDFYISCLGLRIVEEWSKEDDVGCILALPRGQREALLEIHKGPQLREFSGVGLQFRTEDLEAFRASLPSGAEASEPIKRPWGSTYVYLSDPNGIAVVVYEGGL